MSTDDEYKPYKCTHNSRQKKKKIKNINSIGTNCNKWNII